MGKNNNEKFKEIWDESGLNLAAFADYLCISVDTLKKYELGLEIVPEHRLEYAKRLLDRIQDKNNE